MKALLDVDRSDFPHFLTSAEECDRARSQLLDEITAIENQLVAARERLRKHGVYADGAWYQRAKVKLRYHRAKLQAVQDRRAQLRDTWDDALVAIVRAVHRNDPRHLERAIGEVTVTSPELFGPHTMKRLETLITD